MEGKKDNKGQLDGAVVKDSMTIQPLAENAKLSQPFIAQKIGKVCTAAYLITDHLPGDEPVRVRIRSCSVELIKDTHSLDRVGKGEQLERLASIASRAAELDSLFELARIARMISEGNHSLLKRELGAVRDNALSAYGKPVIFTEGYFAVEVPEAPKKEAGASAVSYSHKGQPSSVLYNSPNDVLDNKPKEVREVKDKPKRSSSGSLGKDDRLDTILKLIRKDKSVSIKDIVSFFSDVGEKTIQRDLAKLVGQGLILRTGDKRWSRYSLK